MKYEKLTIKAFKDKLDEGHYESLTGARRAIGKVSDWTNAERDKARALADKYFGADSTEKTAPKAKGKPGKKKAAKKVAAAPKKAPKAAKPAAAKAVGKKRRSTSQQTAASAGANHVSGMTKTDQALLGRIQVIGEYVGTASQAIAAMDAAKSNGSADVNDGMRIAAECLTNAVNAMKEIILTQKSNGNGGSVSDAAAAKRFADTAPNGIGTQSDAPPASVEEPAPPVAAAG